MEARYITDEAGKRRGVILSIEEYERLLEAFEDLKDLRVADEALAEIERGEGGLLSYAEAVKEMEKERQRLREAGELPGDSEE